MKRIFIVGGDGFARECACFVNRLNEQGKDIELAGFLGHGGCGHNVDYKNWQGLYHGEVTEHIFSKHEFCIIGAGYPWLRKKIYTDLKVLGVKLYDLIYASEFLGRNIKIGEGNIIIKSTFTDSIKIGNGNLFNGYNVIGHDISIGDFNFFGPRTQILGNVNIGNSNSAGANAIILPKAKVGDFNKIAPLSVIYKGCKNNGYYIGNPALRTGDVE